MRVDFLAAITRTSADKDTERVCGMCGKCHGSEGRECDETFHSSWLVYVLEIGIAAAFSGQADNRAMDDAESKIACEKYTRIYSECTSVISDSFTLIVCFIGILMTLAVPSGIFAVMFTSCVMLSARGNEIAESK